MGSSTYSQLLRIRLLKGLLRETVLVYKSVNYFGVLILRFQYTVPLRKTNITLITYVNCIILRNISINYHIFFSKRRL
jgi:hypothetical protein